MATCGCHFHAIALAPAIPSTLWGIYALSSPRGGRERLAGWVAFTAAIFCVWVQFEANLRFLFLSP